MKGHKGHHHGHVEHGVHHHHPRAEHAKGGHVQEHYSVNEGSATEGDWDNDESPKDIYAGEHSHVAHEAEERKHGGKIKKHKAKHHVGHAMGMKAHHRADRKPRKSGGRAAGSNMNPLSSAHHGMEPKAHHSYEPEMHGK
jgi:hypothetical protein